MQEFNQGLVASFKYTEWVDLTEDHRSLREDLEKAIDYACNKNMELGPFMIKGALLSLYSILIYQKIFQRI